MKCITVSCLWAADHSVAIAYRPFILICFLAKNPTFRLGLGNSSSGEAFPEPSPPHLTQ